MTFFLRVLFAVVLLLCGAGAGTTAQASATPDHLRGIWARPDCGHADSIYVISAGYVLHMDAAARWVNAIETVRGEEFQGDMLYHLQASPWSGLMRLENDGVFRVAEPPVHPEQPLYMLWGTSLNYLAPEFTRCAKLFDTSLPLSSAEANIPFLLDRINAPGACGGVAPKDFHQAMPCHRALFDVLDADQDGALGRDELMRLYDMVAFAHEGQLKVRCGLDAQAGTALPVSMIGEAKSAAFADTLQAHIGEGRRIDIDTLRAMLSASETLGTPLPETLRSFITAARAMEGNLPFAALHGARRACGFDDPHGAEQTTP